MHCASLHNQKKDNKFKNKKQPDLTENKTVWKSDNQEVKEETFNQTSRRGGEDSQQGCGWKTWVGQGEAAEQVVQHLRADKLRGTTGD